MTYTKPTFVEESRVSVRMVSASDDDVAMAAWVSFAGDDEDRLEDRGRIKGLINFLIRNRHMSPFEHGHFTFVIETPLFVRSEHHRHRTQAYNEKSARYTVFDGEFYVPPLHRPMVQEGKAGEYKFTKAEEWKAKIVRGVIVSASTAAWRSYQFLVSFGVAKEVARMVLPVNLMTRYYATMSPRNLMQFLDLRTDPQALYEIRQVAAAMEDALREAMPLTYEAWKSQKTG